MSFELVGAPGEAELEKLVRWIKNLGPVTTGRLVLHKSIDIPEDIIAIAKKHPTYFESLDGWEQLCGKVTKGSWVPYANERCNKIDRTGFAGEWGNTLHDQFLKKMDLKLDVKEETKKAMYNRLGQKN